MFKALRRKINLRTLTSILIFGLLLIILSVKAAEVENSQEVSSSIQVTQSQNTTSVVTRDTRLTDAEWAHYQQLMQGMDSRWYPQLSPAAVLGLRAETETERQHYADLAAQEEHDKIAREMLFNHAFYLAMRRLYPNEPIIQSFDKTPFNPQKNREHHG